jgi:cytochrome c553
MRIKGLFLISGLLISAILFNGFRSESELSKLMRTMANDMKRVRVKIQNGEKIPMFYKKYHRINTAKPSVESKKGEHYPEYANAFLIQLDRFGKAEKTTQKSEFNSLVKTCIRCHETYCPGPISMLKKLQLP